MGQFEEQILNLSHNLSPDYNQCQCLPKADLKIKTNPNGQRVVAFWVGFGFKLGLRQWEELIIKQLNMGQFEELLLKLSHNPIAL